MLLYGHPDESTASRGDEEALGGPNPRERGCDDQAGGEDVCSTRGGEAGPGILGPGEGLSEDRRRSGERRGFLLRRWPAVYDRIDSPRTGPEQDDQRSRRPLSPDARLPRAGPAGLRHARPPDRGPGREEPRDHEQEGDRRAR